MDPKEPARTIARPVSESGEHLNLIAEIGKQGGDPRIPSGADDLGVQSHVGSRGRRDIAAVERRLRVPELAFERL